MFRQQNFLWFVTVRQKFFIHRWLQTNHTWKLTSILSICMMIAMISILVCMIQISSCMLTHKKNHRSFGAICDFCEIKIVVTIFLDNTNVEKTSILLLSQPIMIVWFLRMYVQLRLSWEQPIYQHDSSGKKSNKKQYKPDQSYFLKYIPKEKQPIHLSNVADNVILSQMTRHTMHIFPVLLVLPITVSILWWLFILTYFLSHVIIDPKNKFSLQFLNTNTKKFLLIPVFSIAHLVSIPYMKLLHMIFPPISSQNSISDIPNQSLPIVDQRVKHSKNKHGYCWIV